MNKEAISYSNIHTWLRNNYGKANKCEGEDCNGKSKSYEYALIKGKTYERNRDNYMQLCASCHRKYDITDETREKMSESSKGQKAWNKELKGCYKQSKETIQKRVSQMMGSANPSWKGDKVGYGGVHCWIRKEYGNADCCKNPECSGKSRTYQWANISGKYERKRTDYIQLCVSCHRKFDKGSLSLVVIKARKMYMVRKYL